MQSIALPAVILVVITSSTLIIVTDWRIRIALLAVQYFGVFFLVSLSWPISMAVTKLMAGWIAGAVLGMALISNPSAAVPKPRKRPSLAFQSSKLFQNLRIRSENVFYLTATIFVGIFALSFAPTIRTWIPGIQDAQLWTGLLLIGMGILQLGFRTDPLSSVLGLLTFLSGFEILYAAIEQSTLVAGLLAVINLSLALVGAYLILAPQMAGDE